MQVYENPEAVQSASEAPKEKMIQALLTIGDQQTLNAGNMQLQIQKLSPHQAPKKVSDPNLNSSAPAFIKHSVATG